MKAYEVPQLYCDDYTPDTLIASSGFDPFDPFNPGRGGKDVPGGHGGNGR